MREKLIKIVFRLIYCVIVVAIPIFIVSITVNLVSHSVDLYTAGFDKYNISKITGINDTQLKEVAKSMVDYFSYRNQTPQVTVISNSEQKQLYNQKELIHLADVRQVIQLFSILQITSILLLIGLATVIYFKMGVFDLLKGIRTGALLTGVITLLLIIWALLDFNSLFLIFHYMSFSNDLWILDPSKDYLIMLFPEGFFNDAAIFIVSIILISAILLWLAVLLLQAIIAKKAARNCANSSSAS